MFRRGHLGVTMLVLAPVAFALVSAGYLGLAFVVGAVVLYLAMLPDVDHRIPGISHRGVTHSLLFAAVVGAALAGVASVLEPVVEPALPTGLTPVGFGFLLGFGAVVSHLVGDLLTPSGVNLLWPHPRTWSLSVTSADSTLWNTGLFVLGVLALSAAVLLAVRGVPF